MRKTANTAIFIILATIFNLIIMLVLLIGSFLIANKLFSNSSNEMAGIIGFFIIGIPIMLHCQKCMMHATAYIDDKKPELDEIVSSKDKLFEFFCYFHNFVNKKLGKIELPVEDARKLYSNNTNLTKLKLDQ